MKNCITRSNNIDRYELMAALMENIKFGCSRVNSILKGLKFVIKNSFSCNEFFDIDLIDLWITLCLRYDINIEKDNGASYIDLQNNYVQLKAIINRLKNYSYNSNTRLVRQKYKDIYDFRIKTPENDFNGGICKKYKDHFFGITCNEKPCILTKKHKNITICFIDKNALTQQQLNDIEYLKEFREELNDAATIDGNIYKQDNEQLYDLLDEVFFPFKIN